MIFRSEDLRFERSALWSIKSKITLFQTSSFPHEHKELQIVRKKLDVTYVVCPYPTLFTALFSILL